MTNEQEVPSRDDNQTATYLLLLRTANVPAFLVKPILQLQSPTVVENTAHNCLPAYSIAFQ